MQKVSILGSTGSIGTNSLDVLRKGKNDYQVFALSGHSNFTLLAEQVSEFAPEVVVVADGKTEEFAKILADRNIKAPQIMEEKNGLAFIASANEVDIVISAIVGAAGLVPSMASVQAGKKLLIANKESLVMAGDLLMQTAKDNNALILPVDSEHNAIFQSLPYGKTLQEAGVRQLILTASGGPFFGKTAEQLRDIKPEDAIKHPTWNMGAKISVDSATLMNKGLELIEAARLFNASIEQLGVIVHRQSWLHCLVVYKDGSTLCELNAPDMRTHIAAALAFPNRLDMQLPLPELDGVNLTFNQADEQTFKCLKLAKQALVAGNNSTVILNAANEIAVAAFLQKQIAFLDIATIIENSLSEVEYPKAETLEDILDLDKQTRLVAQNIIKTRFN